VATHRRDTSPVAVITSVVGGAVVVLLGALTAALVHRRGSRSSVRLVLLFCHLLATVGLSPCTNSPDKPVIVGCSLPACPLPAAFA
jgi:uncharacterized membrane protein YoaK (UPF0700 family)